MTTTIFATIGVNGIVIRSAIPGEPYGTPLPFSAARLWELERQGQVWTSCWARWLWVRGVADDASLRLHQGAPVVSRACQRLPGQIGVDTPSLGSAEGVSEVGICAGHDLNQVVVERDGRVEAQALYPDGLNRLGGGGLK